MMTARSGSGGPDIGTLLPLNEALNPAIAGRKAASLAVLLGHGFRVPKGWVIPADAAAMIASGSEMSEFTELFRELPDVPMAVRSSGIAEDGDEFSLAGQYESILNVCGREAIIQAARRVWTSGQRTQSTNTPSPTVDYPVAGDVQTAILIQPMLQPDVAGVAFSANPVTGNRSEVIINAVSGLGDRLMAGEIDPETWTVSEGSASRTSGDEPVLGESQARRVAHLASDVESSFGRPQDIEWAIVGDDLYLLQARPITALPVRPEFPTLPPGTWMKETNHFSAQISVLQASLYVPNFREATCAMCSAIGALIDRLQLIDRGGELYIQPVPLGERHGTPPPGWVLGLLARVEPTLRARINASKRAIDERVPEKLMDRWGSEWRDALRETGQQLVDVDLPSLSDRALAEHIAAAHQLFQSGIRIHFQLTVPALLYPYNLVTICREFFGWDDNESLMLIAETADASSAPVRAVDALADLAQIRPRVRELMTLPDARLTDIELVDAEYATMVEQYLHDFGHRPLDNEISKPTLAERPELVLNLIRERIASGNDSIGNVASKQQIQRTKAEELVRLRSAPDRRRYTDALELATRSNTIREERVLYTMYQPLAIVRYAVLEAGQRLTRRGVLNQPDDVFYLTIDEVQDSIQGVDASDLKHAVATRRAERAWVSANPGPEFLGDPPAMVDPAWLPEPARTITGAFIWHTGAKSPGNDAESANRLRGVGASAGRYRGPVRIIRDQTDFQRLKPGDVLVCPVTTSAWGILFGTAGALVTDHGGILSHPAIAAREHGLPAVVGTHEATSTLHEGQMVIVDGSTGTVELVDAR